MEYIRPEANGQLFLEPRTRDSLRIPSFLYGFKNEETTAETAQSGRTVFCFRGCLAVEEEERVCKCGKRMHINAHPDIVLRHLCFGGNLSCVLFPHNQFKCPSCGGDLVYDPGSTQMKCIRCSRTTPFGEVDYEKDLQEAKPSEASDNDGNGKEEYHCANCGAVLDTDDYTASTVCRYCGSPMLLESRFSGDVKPSRILPFGFDKKKAQDNFKNWTGTGFLTPASFKTQATMDKVTGVYVPYWLYNYTADVNIKAIGTRTRIERTQTEEIIHTDHFDINRLTQTEYTNVSSI